MNRDEALKHKKKKSRSLDILLWLFIFTFMAVLILLIFNLTTKDSISIILNNRNYYLVVGVVCGLLIIGYLMMYRIDAQNIALNENDLEDTEWLTTKKAAWRFLTSSFNKRDFFK